MRKYKLFSTYLTIAAFLGLIIFTGCGDDNDDDNGGASTNTLNADAGSDQTVEAGDEVTLNGSGSSDSEGNLFTFLWSFTARPDGSSASLSDPTAERPTFTADVAGQYDLSLIITDGTNEDEDNVSILAEAPSFITINADITADQTLADIVSDEKDYLVEGFIDVDASLIIDPGVVIHFADNSGFRITSTGSIQAVGTAADSIIFTGTSETAGTWKGILFVDSENNLNELTYCRISYAGQTEFSSSMGKANLGIGYFLSPSKVKINNTLIRDADGKGVSMDYRADGRFGEFANNKISNNSDLAMTVNVSAVGDLDGNTVFENNGTDAVEIYSTSSSEDVLEDTTWPLLAGGVPYYINAKIHVPVELTLEAGVQLAFDNDMYMRIDDTGALIAVGTEADPIVFTGINKIKGAWRGLYFVDSNNPLNELNNVTLEYGGSTEISSTLGKANLGISYFLGSTRIKINNVTFQESDGYGMSIDYRSDAELSEFNSNTFSNNQLAGLRINPLQIVSLDDQSNYIDNNGNDYIEVYTNSSSEDIPNTVTWINPGVKLLIDGDIHIVGDLSINPGLVMEFESNSGLRVDSEGSLSAIGTANEHILLTGKTKSAGAWKGLQFFATTDPNNALDYVDIEYGGQVEYGVDKANLNVQDFSAESTVNVTNSSFTNSAGYGIAIANGSAVTPVDFATANTFSGNALGNVFNE